MKKHIKTILWLFLIVLIGYRLRLIGINKPSGIWFDEMIVYLQSKQSFPVGIIKNLVLTDILMPLHQLCLHVWMKVFGESDLTLRMFSAVTGSLAIIGAYLTGAKLKDNKTGYLAAILMALNGCAIYFSQEVKFYILALFFCSFNLYFFLRVSENQKDKIGWTGLITTCVLGCYTFSIYIFLAFVQFAYLFFENLKNKNNQKCYWINSGIITVLLIPFLYLNILISQSMKAEYAPSTMFLSFDASTFFSLFQSWMTPYVIAKPDNYTNYFKPFFETYNVFQAIVIFAVLAFTIFFIIFGISKNKLAKKLGIVGISFFFMTCVSGFILNYCLTVRYGVLFIPFFIALTAIGLAEMKTKWLQKMLITFFVALLLFTNVFDRRAAAKTNRTGLKPIADVMEEYKFGKKDIVFLPFGRVDLFFKYYDFDGMILNSTLIYEKVAYESFGIKRTPDIKKDFREYLKADKPTKGEENFFNLNINNEAHKGHYIMFVKGQMKNLDVKKIASDDNMYATESFYFLPPYKFLNNIMDMCEKEFGPGEYHKIYNWDMYVYKIK